MFTHCLWVELAFEFPLVPSSAVNASGITGLAEKAQRWDLSHVKPTPIDPGPPWKNLQAVTAWANVKENMPKAIAYDEKYGFKEKKRACSTGKQGRTHAHTVHE